MTESRYRPGKILLIGSGETAPAAGKAFELVATQLPKPLRILVMETPAGFELNAAQVAGRVSQFLAKRLQNYHPQITQVPAHRRGVHTGTDAPEIIESIALHDMIYMGAGSPTYAVRQLQGSLAWQGILAHLVMGGTLVLASAAVVAASQFALPVYEIYKVGEDLFWNPGLDLFGFVGLHLTLIPHWNNTDGGDELDTSHCFMGASRFNDLVNQLPEDHHVLGIDEHTSFLIDLCKQECQVIGQGSVHILKANGQKTTDFFPGQRFPVNIFGDLSSIGSQQEFISTEVFQQLEKIRNDVRIEDQESIPAEVLALVKERQKARQNKDWIRADQLRLLISNLGWSVQDVEDGSRIIPIG